MKFRLHDSPISAVDKTTFRLMPLDKPTSPMWNMALDEMFMNQSTDQLPVLRFYQWSEPCLSLGYFQNVAEVAMQKKCEASGVSLIRRVTGGGIVEHGKDLTMSLILPERNNFLSGGVSESYQAIHTLIQNSLSEQYPELTFVASDKALSARSQRDCFEEPTAYDLQRDGQKILGSSQRRKNSNILHQTALFLPLDGRALEFLIYRHFRMAWNLEFKIIPLSNQELDSVNVLMEQKYSKAEYSYGTSEAKNSFVLTHAR